MENQPTTNNTGGSMIIKPAVRTFQPALIALWGGSSSGKTYSALRLARGLVGPHGKIGVIDTENRRGLFYADQVGGAWDHLDLQPPFTPERYTEAFRAFEYAGGYNCVIIDSASHVWEGEGGVMDQASNSKSRGLAKWAKPKQSLKKMVNVLLRSPCHVIFCMRSKMGVMQKGSGRDATIESSGLEPIMEKNLIYEMLVSICLGPNQMPMFRDHSEKHWVNRNIPAVKLPAALQHAVKPGEYISEATGEAIRVWLDGATREMLPEAKRVAARGLGSFRGWWPTLTKAEKDQLKTHVEELKEIAIKADEVIEVEQSSDSTDQGDALASGFEGVSESMPSTEPLIESPVHESEPAERAVVQPSVEPPEPSPVQSAPPQQEQVDYTPPAQPPPMESLPQSPEGDDNPF